jgi:hypothetical protein
MEKKQTRHSLLSKMVGLDFENGFLDEPTLSVITKTQ